MIPLAGHAVYSPQSRRGEGKHTAISRKVVGKSARDNPVLGVVDGFEFSVLQRDLKEWQERP